MKFIKANVSILMVLLLISLCACSDKNKTPTPTTPTVSGGTNIQLQPTDSDVTYIYSFVTPLEIPDMSASASHVDLTCKEVFNICKYIVRGELVGIKELKTTKHTESYDRDSYSQVLDFAVKETLGGTELEGNISILYPSSSYNCMEDCVNLLEGNEYIMMLNDTVATSTKVGIEEYAPYSSVYAEYTVISKSDKGYDAKNFMTGVLGIDAEDVKQTYTLKEIRDAIEPYEDELKGMTVLEVTKQRKK
ncbi:MAG: hypothetical protein IJO93_02295 [Clostridia bacterium]|nr:hypothetical protein [Clostridia bacterium]